MNPEKKEMPPKFTGWSFVSEYRNWSHFGELIVVGERNAIDSSYYDCIALDGSSPAVSDGHLREMFMAGKLNPPAE